MSINYRYRNLRRQSGFSLVMVMSIGLIGLMGSMAITSMLFSGKRYSDSTQIQDTALHDAQIAADFAIQKIAYAYQSKNLSLLSTTIALPPNLKTTIKADDPQQFLISKTSPGYDASIFKIPNDRFLIKPDIRQIVSTCQINGIKRQITIVALFYSEDMIAGNSGPGGSPGSNNPNLVFANALKANGQLILNDVKFGTPENYNPKDVFLVSNSELRIPQALTANIPGSVKVFNSNPNATTLDLAPQTRIDGNLEYSGNTKNYTPIADVDGDGGVLGDGRASTKDAIINDGLSEGSQNAFLPTQNATEMANVRSIPEYVNTPQGLKISKIVTDVSSTANSVAEVPPIFQTSSAPSVETTFNKGTYISDSLSIGSSDTLNINGSTQIFIQNSSATNASFNLSGAVNFRDNGQLQLFYRGAKPINIDLSKLNSGNFRAQIYAPNADVTVKLAGKTFNGSITANKLDVSGGNFDAVINPTTLPMPVNPSTGIPQKFAVEKISWTESNKY
ncbi:MAG: hypothetical protein J0H83_03460 [Candidatus Melainabacteria bacterium]|nr:hypothetical protein [Candidatus Melainabacteria bacterium]